MAILMAARTTGRESAMERDDPELDLESGLASDLELTGWWEESMG